MSPTTTTTEPVDADLLDRVRALRGRRQRLGEIKTARAELADRITALRTLRYGLGFRGTDRFFPRPGEHDRCHARQAPGGPMCENEHVGRGLCRNHLRQFNAGAHWGAGGLNMDFAPAEVKWKTKALTWANVSNWVLQDTLEARRWPTADGDGWTQDVTAAHPAVVLALWRWDAATETVVSVPAPPEFPDAQSHWTAYGDTHRQVVHLTALSDELGVMRRDTLWSLFADEPSNRTLSELSGVRENTVAKMRMRWRKELLAAS